MNISITALSGTLAGTKITQIINPAYKYQNIPGSRTDEADIWSSLQIDRVEQRTWCTKQKNTSVRQRQNMIGKKQSWKEKKDQGREESPSYDQHVKPRKKNGKLFWKQSSELVSRLAVFVWKTCARRLLADWFFPVSLDLSFKKWWDFFNIYGKRGKRWQRYIVGKTNPLFTANAKGLLFCVQMAKTDVKMRNSLGQPRSFIMGHLIGQL